MLFDTASFSVSAFFAAALFSQVGMVNTEFSPESETPGYSLVVLNGAPSVFDREG